MEMIYFDHNATAPYSSSVREYLQTGMLEDWRNPSSIYPQAQILEQRIRECGRFIAERLNCYPKHLFWTSGGTESINTVLSPETLRLNRLSGVITSFLEHHASLKKLEYLSESQTRPFYQKAKNEKPMGFGAERRNQQIKIHCVLHNDQGEIDLNNLEKICSQNPRSLLSFLSANNETGVITDIKAISKIARKYDCLVHVDAVQSLGKELVDLEDWDVDFASFSGHKIGALKGVGLLYAKKPFFPLMFGGGQERGMRPGTYNFSAIYSFKQAIQDIDLGKQKHVRRLRDYFEKKLKYLFASSEIWKEIDFSSGKFGVPIKTKSLFLKVNCDKAPRLPNTSNIYCGAGISNQMVLLHLARKGICVSTGSACSAGSPEPSHVISWLVASKDRREQVLSQQEPFHAIAQRALSSGGGSHTDYANSCLRVSFAPSNTKMEVDSLIQSLKEFYFGPLHVSSFVKKGSQATDMAVNKK